MWCLLALPQSPVTLRIERLLEAEEKIPEGAHVIDYSEHLMTRDPDVRARVVMHVYECRIADTLRNPGVVPPPRYMRLPVDPEAETPFEWCPVGELYFPDTDVKQRRSHCIRAALAQSIVLRHDRELKQGVFNILMGLRWAPYQEVEDPWAEQDQEFPEDLVNLVMEYRFASKPKKVAA
jgi:hypothetical protein